MILVDTSVLVNYLKGTENDKTKLFQTILDYNISFGISAYTFLEVLQGARNDKEYQQLDEYLSTQTIYYLPEDMKTYTDAAKIYYTLLLLIMFQTFLF